MTGPEMATACRAAAEVLRVKGWCQFARQNVRGQHCVMGALDVSVCGEDLGMYTERVAPDVVRAIAAHVPRLNEADEAANRAYSKLHYWPRIASVYPDTSRLVDWNNRWGRTADEVITLLEFVALCEEERAKLAAAGAEPNHHEHGSEETPVATVRQQADGYSE